MRLNIPTGSRVLTGAPARPFQRTVIEGIARVVAETPGIVEAHLPLCLVEGVMASPAIILGCCDIFCVNCFGTLFGSGVRFFVFGEDVGSP